jgi:hypothetical protein
MDRGSCRPSTFNRGNAVAGGYFAAVICSTIAFIPWAA